MLRALTLFLALSTPLMASASAVLDRIAAVVDQRVILLSEVERRVAIARQLGNMAGSDLMAQRRRALRDLIDEVLLEVETTSKQIEVSDAEIDAAIEELKRQNGLDQASLERALAGQGYTLKSYREEVERQLRQARLINAEVRSKVQVSDAEIDAALKQRHAQGAYEVRARHILIRLDQDAPKEAVEAARARAEALLERIRNGEPFDEVARRSSDDPGTAAHGGDLGWFGRGLMLPAFDEAAFSAEPGSVVGPVRTRFGFHLIQVLARREPSAHQLAKERQAVRAEIYGKAVEAELHRYLEALRARADIEILIPELATDES